MTAPLDTLLVDRPAPGVVLVTLNRLARANALTRRMFDELAAVVEDVRTDQAARVLVLTGAGDAFSAGYDLAESAECPTVGDLRADRPVRG